MIWLSLGENCLPDDILKRHDLKSFSTPYSPSRSNIDYAIALEKAGYEGLLDPSKLTYGDFFGTKTVRSTRYAASDDIFHPSVSSGFEFPHHDLIVDASARESFQRKTDRLLSIKGKKTVTFLYHHRVTPKTDFALLFKKLSDFAGLYSSGDGTCTVAVFWQTIVKPDGQRELVASSPEPNVLGFDFRTARAWEGLNNDVFWARVDDDLICDMLRSARQERKS